MPPTPSGRSIFTALAPRSAKRDLANELAAICPSAINRIPVSGRVDIWSVWEGIYHSYHMENNNAVMGIRGLLAGKLSSIWSMFPKVMPKLSQDHKRSIKRISR